MSRDIVCIHTMVVKPPKNIYADSFQLGIVVKFGDYGAFKKKYKEAINGIIRTVKDEVKSTNKKISKKVEKFEEVITTHPVVNHFILKDAMKKVYEPEEENFDRMKTTVMENFFGKCASDNPNFLITYSNIPPNKKCEYYHWLSLQHYLEKNELGENTIVLAQTLSSGSDVPRNVAKLIKELGKEHIIISPQGREYEEGLAYCDLLGEYIKQNILKLNKKNKLDRGVLPCLYREKGIRKERTDMKEIDIEEATTELSVEDFEFYSKNIFLYKADKKTSKDILRDICTYIKKRGVDESLPISIVKLKNFFKLTDSMENVQLWNNKKPVPKKKIEECLTKCKECFRNLSGD